MSFSYDRYEYCFPLIMLYVILPVPLLLLLARPFSCCRE